MHFRFIVSLLVIIQSAYGQDVTERPLVVQVPQMSQVIKKQGLTYLTDSSGPLQFDIYYPPGFSFKSRLPVVILNNGSGGLENFHWRVYADWAKLMASNGMIGITYQCRQGSNLANGKKLLQYIGGHAGELNIDNEKIGLWTCSSNTPVGFTLANDPSARIKTLVIYYGVLDSMAGIRQDLPMLLVRAGLDAQNLNKGIERFTQSCFEQDVRFELVNYLEGIHAFDLYNNTDESRDIIRRTVRFFKDHLVAGEPYKKAVLTNRSFMWLVNHNRLDEAISLFRETRTANRKDPDFQPVYNAVIRENILNANAYTLLQSKNFPAALALFHLAVESYPDSPNAFESLSEAYENSGNKEAALENAEICLQKIKAATASASTNSSLQTVKQQAEMRIKRLKTGKQ